MVSDAFIVIAFSPPLAPPHDIPKRHLIRSPRPIPSGAGFSRLLTLAVRRSGAYALKTSITSPTSTSLQCSRRMPQSFPAFTSGG